MELQVTEEVASKNLQLLAASGFLRQNSVGKFLFNSLAEQHALVAGVLELGLSEEQVIFTVTALTHVRRVLILKALNEESVCMKDLCRKTGISKRAMRRQWGKLERRGFVKEINGQCRLKEPANDLGGILIQLALK